jgi:phytoene desaturase
VKIGIIGSGIAGLASAVRMASRGYEVEVFEANSYPGGKLTEIQMGGYRFDAGPSLFTMPMYVDEVYQTAQAVTTPPLPYERIPVVCNYFWEDGTRVSAYDDQEQFGKEIQEKLGVAPEVLSRSLKDSARKYELTGRTFLEKNLRSWKTWLTKDVAKALLRLPQLDVFQTMDGVNRRIFKHPKLVQLFNRYATYNGSNPYKVSGILNIIPHFEYEFGAYFPKGGMHAISQHLYQLALEKGVQFYFDHPVERILTKGKSVTGFQVKGEEKRFDRVISNMDIFFTYRRLLPEAPHPEKILKQEKSTSALIFYWGIKKQFPELDLHNIFFSENYRAEFDHLAKGTLYEDPTVYINITQKYEAGDAPEGCENWFTMINVPFDSGQDWDTLIEVSRDRIVKKLSRILGTDIESLIEVEDVLDPRTIESKTASHLGALYGTSSNNRMAAFMRHPNFSPHFDNLYFCGGSVHPGGGIPLCLLSARILDELMPD